MSASLRRRWIAMIDATHPQTLPEQASNQLRLFRDLLLRWNQRFNLTAITDPGEIDRKLIGDALAMLPAIDDAIDARRAAARRQQAELETASAARLVDIGSGAGFPGIVMSIARPELEVVLVEATGKKAGFLEHAILELGLTNTKAIHGRAEELARQPRHRARYQIATARAVAALPVLMELCVPFLEPGGHALFPKGGSIESELAAGQRAAALVGARIVSDAVVPSGGGETVTRLIIAVKIEATPDRYPRRSGIPAKEPLGRA
jgi:16S rRNA (guanine527-N7)-methyltransferase